MGSFLCVCACRCACSPRVPSLTPSLLSSIHDLIDDTAVEATHLVFSSVGDQHVRHVSFDQFGQWYNSEGYVVLPWLELLDLSKWPFPTGAREPSCSLRMTTVRGRAVAARVLYERS